MDCSGPTREHRVPFTILAPGDSDLIDLEEDSSPPGADSSEGSDAAQQPPANVATDSIEDVQARIALIAPLPRLSCIRQACQQPVSISFERWLQAATDQQAQKVRHLKDQQGLDNGSPEVQMEVSRLLALKVIDVFSRNNYRFHRFDADKEAIPRGAGEAHCPSEA